MFPCLVLLLRRASSRDQDDSVRKLSSLISLLGSYALPRAHLQTAKYSAITTGQPSYSVGQNKCRFLLMNTRWNNEQANLSLYIRRVSNKKLYPWPTSHSSRATKLSTVINLSPHTNHPEFCRTTQVGPPTRTGLQNLAVSSGKCFQNSFMAGKRWSQRGRGVLLQTQNAWCTSYLM